jgi:hypothetical protein
LRIQTRLMLEIFAAFYKLSNKYLFVQQLQYDLLFPLNKSQTRIFSRIHVDLYLTNSMYVIIPLSARKERQTPQAKRLTLLSLTLSILYEGFPVPIYHASKQIVSSPL